MTLDEAIERYMSNAEYERTHGNLQGCLEFRQLAEWLKELKENNETLGKIRAEISDFEEEVFQRPNTDYSDYAAVRHCLEIIDEYRNEVTS